ncbi:MAG: M56 family metallopeptidase [Pseudomonadota bacterium]
MSDLVSVLALSSVDSSALLVILAKGTIICLLGVSIGSESAAMPAIVRHRIALGTVFGLAALPLMASIVSPWGLPILSHEAGSPGIDSSLLVLALMVLYLSVAGTLLARLSLDLFRIAKLSYRAKPMGTAAALLPNLDHPKSATPVKCSTEIRSPLTWGWLRPQILVPSNVNGWDSNEMRMVLQHELAHVLRMDWAGHLLARCIHALYWPVPGIRSLLRQLSLSAEQACDDRVLASGVAAPEYAAMLLRQAQGVRIPASVPLGNSSELGTRIRYLVVEIVDHSAFANGSAATFLSGFLLTSLVATAQLTQRPDIPVLEWGSAEPNEESPEYIYAQPTVRVDPAVLAALEPGPVKPLPPPEPLKPPQLKALEKPTVPPPPRTAPTQ